MILAIVLAPTDAALGQAVVTEPRVPGPIRQGLNIESGLNDGICVPLLFTAVAAADIQSHIWRGAEASNASARGDRLWAPRGVAAGLLIGASSSSMPAVGPDRRHLAPGDSGHRRGARLRIASALGRLWLHRGLCRRDVFHA